SGSFLSIGRVLSHGFLSAIVGRRIGSATSVETASHCPYCDTNPQPDLSTGDIEWPCSSLIFREPQLITSEFFPALTAIRPLERVTSNAVNSLEAGVTSRSLGLHSNFWSPRRTNSDIGHHALYVLTRCQCDGTHIKNKRLIFDTNDRVWRNHRNRMWKRGRLALAVLHAD